MRKTLKLLVLFTTISLAFISFPVSIMAQQTSGPGNDNTHASYSIFITGNTGMGATGNNQKVLRTIIKNSKDKYNKALLLSGNIIGNKGLSDNPKSNSQLNDQLSILNSFDGRVIVTPGRNEWKPDGHASVDDLEKFIQSNSKAKFYPNDGCPLKVEDLSDDIVLIVVDSQWFLEDWDKYPYINQRCDIYNRTIFFLEFESALKKHIGKTKIVALSHPVATNTNSGILRKTGGFSTQDYQNAQYRKLRKRLTSLAQQVENVIFISGQDRNLQLIEHFGIPQIISGSSTGTKRAKARKEEDFVGNKLGYARLDLNEKGAASVTFFEVRDESQNILYTKVIQEDRYHEEEEILFSPKSAYKATKRASVYRAEETSKSGFYRNLWGDHYREIYSKEISANVVFLDTLLNGLSPLRAGGGYQTRSLRLADKDGKQYVLRALRKSGAKFLQKAAFQDSYVLDKLKGSALDRFVLDFYTTSHPYTSFAIGTMADAVELYHTNPELYYVPKQERLGRFNKDFGDELYMFEERIEPGQKEVSSFGKPDDILSTEEVFMELVKSGRSGIDESMYIRARIFDMLIGDWDRHEDQWRWGEYQKGDGSTIYRPIPRDRDQAFSIFDGSIVSFLTCGIPDLRKMQSFDEDLVSTKWFNFETYYLDLTLINKSDWTIWEEQAKFIQQNLTDQVIEDAFENIPAEVKGPKVEEIKSKLKGRRGNIVDLIRDYFEHYNKFDIVLGSFKDDIFEIERMSEGKTRISVSNKFGQIYDRIFYKEETKEIWLYGLDGQDVFNVKGKGNKLIDLKFIGGRKNDTYNFENTKKAKLYDYKSKPNTIINPKANKRLVDDFDVNTYDHRKVKYNVNQFRPLISFNPDDGVRIGFTDKYSVYGMQENPFTQQHKFSAAYYTGTTGVALSYGSEFANIFPNWNFGLESKYTSPNFAMNFFGIGNESEYDRDNVDLDFNRVRISTLSFAPYLVWRGRDGGSFFLKPFYESFSVENTEGRFISQLPADDPVFERQHYVGGEFKYNFRNMNDNSFPTLGMEYEITAGYKTYVGDNEAIENEFGYVSSYFDLDYGLGPGGNLVLATQIGGKAILNDNYEFYHGATLGGTNSLRGFRNERFNGKYAYYQNTDLRLRLGKFRTSIIPIKYGITGGFDYGRVWIENDNSKKWHNSVGGSFWFSGLDAFSANLGYYTSSDGGRVVFLFGFAF